MVPPPIKSYLKILGRKKITAQPALVELQGSCSHLKPQGTARYRADDVSGTSTKATLQAGLFAGCSPSMATAQGRKAQPAQPAQPARVRVAWLTARWSCDPHEPVCLAKTWCRNATSPPGHVAIKIMGGSEAAAFERYSAWPAQMTLVHVMCAILKRAHGCLIYNNKIRKYMQS